MPFDNKPQEKLTLADLAARLRDHPDTWPPGFGPWNYGEPRTCAIGMYGQITGRRLADRVPVPLRFLAGEFRISSVDADDIFIGAGRGKLFADVTPTDVADAIDRVLLAREAVHAV